MQPVPGRLWGLSKTFEATKVACIKSRKTAHRHLQHCSQNFCVPRLRCRFHTGPGIFHEAWTRDSDYRHLESYPTKSNWRAIAGFRTRGSSWRTRSIDWA